MAGDLGKWRDEVHARAAEVLHFWFEEIPPEKHFAKDAALDAEIDRRFGKWVDDLATTDATHCWDNPDDLLAAIIATDQFSRNIHRDSAAAYANDFLATWLTLYAIGKGWDDRYPPERRAFVYMPLMHSEDWRLQSLSLGKFEALGIEDNLRFAREHRDVIMRFGRFPSRNAALGRTSTPEEEAYLSQPGAGW
jgi:uncharacterized protein (DUF924 family)